MVLTRSMMKKRSRPSFYSLDLSSGSSSVFIRRTKDSHGNTQREVIDLRKVEVQQPDSNNFRKRSSATVVGRFVRHRRSRGSSLWESQPKPWPKQLLVQDLAQEEFQPIAIAQETAQQEFQPISMSWWLRTFRGLENQVGREVRQMLALQLGLFEQFKQWDDNDRMQLSKSLPDATSSLEMIQSRVGALVAWVKRLQAILEQDSVEKIHRQTGALVGWAQHLHALLQQDPVLACGTFDSIGDFANQVCKPPLTAADIPKSSDHVEAVCSECPIVDAPLNPESEFVADAHLSPVIRESVVAQGTCMFDAIEDSAKQVCERPLAAAEITMSVGHVEKVRSESSMVDAPSNSGSEFVGEAALSPVVTSSLPSLVDPFTCMSVAVPPYIRRSRSRGLSLVR